MGSKKRRLRKFTDDECIKALKATGGLIYKTAERLGCCAPSVRKRIEDSVRVRNAFEDIRGKNIDLAEDELLKLIKAGDIKAITFYLNSVGKSRGYNNGNINFNTVYQTNITNNQINVDLSSLSREELKLLSKMAGIPFHDSSEVLERVEKEIKCLPQ